MAIPTMMICALLYSILTWNVVSSLPFQKESMVNAMAVCHDTVYVGGLPGNTVHKIVADRAGNMSYVGHSDPVACKSSGIKEIVIGEKYLYVCSRSNGYGINVDYKRPDYVASFEEAIGFTTTESDGKISFSLSDEHCPSRWCGALKVSCNGGKGSLLLSQKVRTTNDSAEFIFWFKSEGNSARISIPLIQDILSVALDRQGRFGLIVNGKKHFGGIRYPGGWMNVKVVVSAGNVSLSVREQECPSKWTEACSVGIQPFSYDHISFGVNCEGRADVFLDEYAYCHKDIDSNSYLNGTLTVLDRKSLKVVNSYELDLRCLSMLLRGNMLYLGLIGGLNVYDLSEPSSPKLVGTFHDSAGRYWTYPLKGKSDYRFRVPGQELQRMDFMILPDGRKVIGGGCDTHGVLLLDVTNPSDPKLFKQLFSTPQVEVKERVEKKERYIEWGVTFDYPYIYSTVAAVHSLLHTEYYSGKLTEVSPTPDMYGIKIYDISAPDHVKDTIVTVPVRYNPIYVAKEGDSCPNMMARIGDRLYLNFADKGVAVFRMSGFDSSFEGMVEVNRSERVRYISSWGNDLLVGGGAVQGPWTECNVHLLRQNGGEYGLIADNTAFAKQQLGKEIDEDEKRDNVSNPVSVKKNGDTKYCKYTDWRSGFFPGSLWYVYELSGDKKFLAAARKYTEAIDGVQNITGNHDVGFMTMCSFGNGYRLTGDERYKEIIIQAAKSLVMRFRPEAGIIQSWDEKPWHPFKCAVVIDNMMNLELLCKAFEFTGDSTFVKVAVSHADRTLKEHFREDGSCYHVVDYDIRSGKVLKRATFQGYSDESIWSRGQGWVIYGFSRMYRYTGDRKYLDQALKTFNMLKAHPNLDSDLIPWWDMCDPAIPNTSRDASAAAVIASALYDIGTFDIDNPEQYIEYADKIIASLSTPSYRAVLGENNNFILMHSSGNVPHDSEIDVPLNYADYYFLEALARRKQISDRKDIPVYYNKYFDIKSADIVSLSRRNLSGFFFWTDTHLSSNALNAPALIGNMAVKMENPRVIWGGDAIPAFIKDIMSFWNIQKRMNTDLMRNVWMYNIRGNHEFTCKYQKGGREGKTFSQETTSELLAEAMNGHVARNLEDSGACYYYFDDNGVRYLVFDGTDSVRGDDEPFGTIYGIGKTQMGWMLNNGIMSASQGTRFVVLMHEPFAEDFDMKNHYAELRSVVNAIHNHIKVTVCGEVYDFSKREDLSVLLVLAGHNHHDMQTFQDGILHVTTCSDAKYQDFRRSPFMEQASKRNKGNINEGAFDYVSISKDCSRIEFIRTGVGYDRIFNLEPIRMVQGSTMSLNGRCPGAVWDIYDSRGNKYVSGPGYTARWDLKRDVASISADGTVSALGKGESVIVATVGSRQIFFNLKVDDSSTPGTL